MILITISFIIPENFYLQNLKTFRVHLIMISLNVSNFYEDLKFFIFQVLKRLKTFHKIHIKRIFIFRYKIPYTYVYAGPFLSHFEE